MSQFQRPVLLNQTHECVGFCSGEPTLDRWLVERAWPNELSGASRTFVTTPIARSDVVGFYSLAASSVRLGDAPGIVRRNMPDPIPVILLGRLAIDQSVQGCGLGRALLQDSVRRVLAASDVIGVRALLVHAINDHVTGFYRNFGFVPSPVEATTLFLPLARIKASSDVRRSIPWTKEDD